MITIVEGHNAPRHGDLLASMFRLRARMLGALGWQIVVDEHGQERDKFDDMAPVYVISQDECRAVDGALRLLPSTGPTLFRECFADTVPDGALLASPAIWECSRLCALDLGAALDLLVAASELSLRAGIETIVCNLDAVALRFYRKVGARIAVLGHTNRYGKTVYLGTFPIDEATIATVRNFRVRHLDARSTA